MKLNAVQWLWMTGAVLFFAAVMLDIANVMDVPPIYLLLGSTSLTAIGWWVMPSIKEIKRAQRKTRL